MTTNAYLLAQAAVVATAAAPSGMTSGEWFALGSLLLVIGGVVYKAGVASQKAQTVESLVTKELKSVSDKMDTLLGAQVDRARFEENVDGRLRVLEGAPVHTHQRATDR